MRTVALISLLLGCDVGVATDAASTTAPNRARAPQSITTTRNDPPCDYVYSGDQLIEDTCNVRRFTYDARGLLIESGDEVFTYDAGYKLIEANAPERRRVFHYDSEGRIVTIEDNQGARVDFVYEAEGRLLEEVQTWPSGVVSRHIRSYDDAGRLIAIDRMDRGPDGTVFAPDRYEYSYDAQGELVERRFNDWHRLHLVPAPPGERWMDVYLVENGVERLHYRETLVWHPTARPKFWNAPWSIAFRNYPSDSLWSY